MAGTSQTVDKYIDTLIKFSFIHSKPILGQIYISFIILSITL